MAKLTPKEHSKLATLRRRQDKGTLTSGERFELKRLESRLTRRRRTPQKPVSAIPVEPIKDATPNGAAPPISFDAGGLHSEVIDADVLGVDGEPNEESAPTPEAAEPEAKPVADVPTAMAMELAEKIVDGLVKMGRPIEELWGFPPLLGLDPIVVPTLKMAWAYTLDRFGITGKLEDMAKGAAAPIAAVASTVYLGGGGLYAGYMLHQQKEQAKARETASEMPTAAASEKPAAESKPKRPSGTIYNEMGMPQLRPAVSRPEEK